MKEINFIKMQSISKHKSILEVLRTSQPKLRKLILQNCDNNVICALVEIIHNLLQGRIQMSPKQKKKIQKYKKQFRLLSEKCIRNKNINKKKARKVVVQTGGALPFLIPLIAPLIAKAALAGAVSTGVGIATKKLLDK